MLRVIEFDLVTKSEANLRFASEGGMHAKAKRTADQREATGAVLRREFPGATFPRFVTQLVGPRSEPPRFAPMGSAIGLTVPHDVHVTLVRIAPGTLDDDNVRGALKAVRDEVAAWIDRDDRDKTLRFDYGQESHGADVYRVRIEIADKFDGEPKRVILRETASEGRLAARTVKRAITKARKAPPHEQALANLTGRAIGRALPAKAPKPSRDPGDERPARELADCSTCGAKVPHACSRIGGERMIFGVHVARAKAAGLHVPSDDRAQVHPARSGKARRKVPTAAPSSLASFAAVPWEQNRCPACNGHVEAFACASCKGTGRRGLVLAPLLRYEGTTPPETITFSVPAEHRDAHGFSLTLTRRPFTVKGSQIWLFERISTT